MITIKDVAKIAGVSVATVSRVINESGYVNIDTRKKVEAAIRQSNYSPNEVARSLYKRKSKLIGLLLPDITNPFFHSWHAVSKITCKRMGTGLFLAIVTRMRRRAGLYPHFCTE